VGQGSDRRKFVRLATEDMMSFAYVDAPDRLAVGKDISAGGIRFQVIGCEINLGDVLRVTFNIGERTVTSVGRVVRATELDALTHDIGLEFLEIDADDLKLLEESTGQLPAV
jgi:hypothetical protein